MPQKGSSEGKGSSQARSSGSDLWNGRPDQLEPMRGNSKTPSGHRSGTESQGSAPSSSNATKPKKLDRLRQKLGFGSSSKSSAVIPEDSLVETQPYEATESVPSGKERREQKKEDFLDNVASTPEHGGSASEQVTEGISRVDKTKVWEGTKTAASAAKSAANLASEINGLLNP